MKDPARAQRLEKLLARVQANAEAGVRERALTLGVESDGEAFVDRTDLEETEHERTPWPTAEVATSFPDPPEMSDDEGDAIALRIETRHPPRRRSSRPPGAIRPPSDRPRTKLGTDRWSVLFGEPDPGPVASFASEVPRAPLPMRADPSWEEEPAPPSALEQAVQNAVREKVFDRGGIWIDVVAELKERRSSASIRAPENDGSPVLRDLLAAGEPEVDPATTESESSSARPVEAPPLEVSAIPPNAPPVLAARADPVDATPSEGARGEGDGGRSTPPPVSSSVAPGPGYVFEAMPPAPPSWRAGALDLRRSAPPTFAPASWRMRRRSLRWTYAKRLVSVRAAQNPNITRFVVFSAIVALAAVLVSVAWTRRSAQVASANQPAPGFTPNPLPGGDGKVARDVAPVVGVTSDKHEAAQAPPSTVSPEADPPPADAADLPETFGYLEVLSEGSFPVYLNGLLAGETQRWLRVGCGWRFLRLARKGAPPAGSSFPLWATEGRSVLVPCRGVARVELEPD